MSNSQASSEHEIQTFLRVQAKLDHLREGMPVKIKGPLNDALEKLSCFPFVSLPLDSDSIEFSIAGQVAGTLQTPNVDLIMQKSTPSSFGKGEKTVTDEAYRRGREIPAADIQFGGYSPFVGHIGETVSAAMFVGRSAELKLYKLAVYTDGGHFDWHMDSTHSDEHHATVLLALNTSWEGGDLVLRRNGVETRADMKPTVAQDGSTVLQAVAFYTDVEHKVEPVSKGVRIVLQYDVHVVGWSKAKNGSKGEDQSSGSMLESVESLYDQRQYYKGVGTLIGDPVSVKKIIVVIRNLLKSGVEEVAFAMQYLHRKSSILPQFLKGSDALLYQGLVKSFDVSLHPVVLQETTDYEGSYEDCCAYRFDHTVPKTGADVESDAGEVSDEDLSDSMEQDHKSTVFYVPNTSAIKQISSNEYIEHTGNEAQPGEHKYFGGGMFVRKRKSA